MSTISEFEHNPHQGSEGFEKWLNTFVDEKALSLEQQFEKEGPSGLNIIPLGAVIAALKRAPRKEQAAIKSTLVRLDFVNADVTGFFEHLAGAIAI